MATGRRGVRVLLLCAVGCAPAGVERVEGLRGGVGYWPEDSRTAVEGAIDADLDGVQLDVVLTADHVPVLAPEPFFDPERCALADGSALPDRILVRSLTADQLGDIVCGGVPDPATPNALVVAEAPLTLDELIERLHRGPYLAVHLAVHQDSPETPPIDVFAKAVVDRWLAADLPNDLYVSSPDPAVLLAFDGRARAAGSDLFAIRTWPAPGASPAEEWLQNEGERAVGGLDYRALVEEIGADGLWVDAETADPWQLRAAARAGVPVWLGLAPDRPRVERWAELPAHTLVTAYPGDLP